MPTPRRASLALAILVAIATAGSGCATRTVRKTFYEDSATRIVLRHQRKSGESIDRGYSHPIAIARVRLAHVLSRIDVRTEAKKGAQRAPALPTEALYVIADHLSKALREADSSQEIARTTCCTSTSRGRTGRSPRPARTSGCPSRTSATM
jgi:hypothetical protein